MRHNGSASRATRALRRREGASPSLDRDSGRTIKTTLIPAPRPAGGAVVRPLTGCAQRVGSTRRDGARSQHLHLVLAVGDALAVLFGFYFVTSFVSAIGPGSWLELAFQMVTVTGVGLLAIRSQGLWVSRLNAVRAIELSRITRAVVLMGLGAIVLDRGAKLYFHVEEIFVGCVAVWLVLVGWRSVYRTWLAAQRKSGRFARRVVIVGTDRRAMALTDLFATHPEVGVQVVGLVGSAREAREARRGELWLANYADADEVLTNADIDGVVLCSSDINPALLNQLIRGERDATATCTSIRACRASTSGGCRHCRSPTNRCCTSSLRRCRGVQIGFKRAFDVAVGAGLLVVLFPLLALIAVLVKLEDRGPVLFRQRRVGRDGVEFAMVKFRSMCIDAEAKLAEVRAHGNERTGPLFKMDGGDPRVTRIGRFLRATSLDELPQLLNVVRGDMSLVGPRPALASEVAEFPSRARTPATTSAPASPGCGRSRRATTRRSRRTAASTCSMSRTGRSPST